MTKIDTTHSLKRLQRIGFISIFVVLGGIALWATLGQLNGAVIASATIVADTYSKKIQHREGGIIKEINVRDGDVVKAGQTLVTLDSSDAKSEVAILRALLDEATAKQARLVAQREGAAMITFPADLLARANEPELSAILNGQSKLFEARRQTLTSKKDQLAQQIDQLKQQSSGITSQTDSKDKQLKFIETELVGLRNLKQKGLVPLSRVSEMERESARLSGERGELVASLAGTGARVSEVNMQILQLDEENLAQTLSDLRDVEARIAELKERLIVSSLKLERSVITSPIDGVVYQSIVHTVGGVAGAGETLMLVSPENDVLVLQAQVRPQDIDQMFVGQVAHVKFPAFSTRQTPDVMAEVNHVAADATRADINTPPFYEVRLILSAGELAKLGDNKLKSGMPAEAFIQTQSMTPLRYLLKPLTDQFSRALRES